MLPGCNDKRRRARDFQFQRVKIRRMKGVRGCEMRANMGVKIADEAGEILPREKALASWRILH